MLEPLPPTQIKFGTDGWRAVVGEDYTFDNVRACAAGVTMYLKAHGLVERGLIVGYDARFASEDFAVAVAEVAAAAGIKVALADQL
jgi:phosphomannomutase